MQGSNPGWIQKTSSQEKDGNLESRELSGTPISSWRVCRPTRSTKEEIKDALDIWQEMLDSDIYLIPIRLEDCEVPEGLRDFQWVNLFEQDGWARLVKAI
jgi:hypothetical protein